MDRAYAVMVTYSMELVEETFELHVSDNFKCYWNWFNC